MTHPISLAPERDSGRNRINKQAASSRKLEYLVLAPHAVFPPHDGASLRSFELARQLMLQHHSVRLVAKHRDYCSYSDFERTLPPDRERSKLVAAVVGLTTGRGYHAGKHITRPWLKRARKALATCDPEIVHVHFLFTIPHLQRELRGHRLLVDTHNYDPEFFKNLTDNSSNPLIRYLGGLSTRHAVRGLRAIAPGQTLIHVTDSDARRFRLLRPDCNHAILPNGCQIRPRRRAPEYSCERKNLYFLGLLSARMNVDALAYFAREIWPSISNHAHLHVFGRQPGPDIERLCADNNWILSANIPEQDLARKIESMHYAVLPFNYSAGSKLKLLDACARGVPILTTPDGVRGHATVPDLVHVVRTPTEWLHHVVRTDSPSGNSSADLLNYAWGFTWNQLAESLHTLACDSENKYEGKSATLEESAWSNCDLTRTHNRR